MSPSPTRMPKGLSARRALVASLRISGAECSRTLFAPQHGRRTTEATVPRSLKESVYEPTARTLPNTEEAWLSGWLQLARYRLWVVAAPGGGFRGVTVHRRA